MNVTTVLGKIDASELGMTSMHDHTFIDMSTAGGYLDKLFPGIPDEMKVLKPENYTFFKSGSYLVCKELQKIDDLDLLTKEFGYFTSMGGKTVCDPSPIGIRGDVRKMQELSRRLNMNLVCATGLYHEMAIPVCYRGKSEEEYYALFQNEIENGIDGTDVHPGFLKGALAAGTDTEIAIVSACIHLSAETGLSVHIHTEPTLDGDRLLEIVEQAVNKYGARRDKVLICHMDNRITMGVPVNQYLTDPTLDRTLDLTIQKKLLALGYNIGLDTWGVGVINTRVFMADQFERLKALITLLDAGYENQIVLGNDFSDLLQTRSYGGSGVTKVFDIVIPKLKELGREEMLQKLLYENPARILSV